jgi:hypothetical protein
MWNVVIVEAHHEELFFSRRPNNDLMHTAEM